VQGLINLIAESEAYNAYKNAMFSLIFDLGGIIPGILLYKLIIPFERSYRWIIYLYPAMLSVRGVINGIFTGRLSTGLHLGIVKANFKNNTEYFWNLYFSMMILCAFGGCFLGPLISLATGSDTVEVSAVAISSMVLSFFMVSGVTLVVAFTAFKKGYDPDYLVYPIMSTIADILVTLSYFLVIWLIFNNGVILSMFIIFILILPWIIYIIKTNVISMEFIEILSKITLSVIVTLFIAFLTGTTLGISKESFPPYVYIVYPATIDTIGDVGSIVGSLATTRLALGNVRGFRDYITENFNELVGIKLALLTMFAGYTLLPSVTIGKLSFKCFLILITGVVSSILIALISLFVAFLAYRVKLDPDDFVNPLVSTFSDLITTVIMIIFVRI